MPTPKFEITPADGLFKDTDKILRFFVVTGAPIKIADTIEVGDTTGKVVALKEAVASAALIRFGNFVLTTDAAYQAGDVDIGFTATTGTLPKDSIGYVIQDITSWTFEFLLKTAPEGTTLLT